MTQPFYSPDLAPCDFWLFPKLKSPLKGKRFQTVSEIQENTTGQLMASVRSPGSYFERDWGVTVLCTVFLIFCIFFRTCLYFSWYMPGCLLDRPPVLFYDLLLSWWQVSHLIKHLRWIPFLTENYSIVWIDHLISFSCWTFKPLPIFLLLYLCLSMTHYFGVGL